MTCCYAQLLFELCALLRRIVGKLSNLNAMYEDTYNKLVNGWGQLDW